MLYHDDSTINRLNIALSITIIIVINTCIIITATTSHAHVTCNDQCVAKDIPYM